MQKGEISRRHQKRQGGSRGRTGPGWAQAGQPSPFRALFTTPFDLDDPRVFIVLVRRATHHTICHSPLRSREERDTIPDVGTLQGRPRQSSQS
jgi:hypothetical protein